MGLFLFDGYSMGSPYHCGTHFSRQPPHYNDDIIKTNHCSMIYLIHDDIIVRSYCFRSEPVTLATFFRSDFSIQPSILNKEQNDEL